MRLDGHDHHIGGRDGGAIVCGDLHAIVVGDNLQSGQVDVGDGDVTGRQATGQQATNEAASHVAATDQGDAQFRQCFHGASLLKRAADGSSRSLTEQARADAQQRGALGDSWLKVIAHAHRQRV